MEYNSGAPEPNEENLEHREEIIDLPGNEKNVVFAERSAPLPILTKMK